MKFWILLLSLVSISSYAADAESAAQGKNAEHDCVCRTMRTDRHRNGPLPRAENKDQCCSFTRSPDVVQCIWVEDGKAQSCQQDVSSN